MTAKRFGLVLTAGGARAAYQAGVLKRMGELIGSRPSPFQIVTGASAGAMNGAMIASGSENFVAITRQLADFWSKIHVNDVFRTDWFTLGSGASRWIRDVTGISRLLGGHKAYSLFDTSPMETFLKRNLPIRNIDKNIRNGHLFAVAVSATSYLSGVSYTFVEGQPGHPMWNRNRKISLTAKLDVPHIRASCAIPVLFEPIMLDTGPGSGSFYFGDGGLRLVTPFSPAIRLGATHVFAIGLRSHAAMEARAREELMGDGDKMQMPPIAQIVGTTMNTVFLDHLDSDYEHLVRMNQILRDFGRGSEDHPVGAGGMRIVEPFIIYPSEDLATIATHYINRVPRSITLILDGMGSSKAQGADLLSYLLFDEDYSKALIQLGYDDANRRADEIRSFIGV